jgi:hypothetical protein
MNSMNPSNLMVMTRYLYVKEEVVVAILTSMLDNEPVAIYWAYELYYSGFEEETIEIIFKIYYYLFASLNPDMELYLFEKLAEWRTSPSTNAYVINDIMQTLLIRPYDTDVFLLHRMAVYLDYDADISCLNMSAMSNMDLAAYFVALKDECDSLVPAICAHYGCADWSIVCPFPLLKPIVLLSRCIATQNKNERCLPLYIKTKPADALKYETRDISPPYMALKTVCLQMDPNHYLAIFDVQRRTSPSAIKIYHQCWLMCASYSPVWMARIVAYGGSIVANKIVFAEEEGEEAFYERYGYEPEEQTMEVQRRNIPPIMEGKTWSQLVRKGIFPETEFELNMIINL